MKKTDIGYFKYESSIPKKLTEIPYYPINDIILNSLEHIKYEFENNVQKKINGKLVVLI